MDEKGMNIIVTTEKRLLEIFNMAILPLVSQQKVRESEKEKFYIDESLSFLKEKGYDVSKSTLYKATHSNSISYSKFGNKVLIERSELLRWAESKVSSKNISCETALQLAKCVISKEKRGGRKL